MQINFFWCMFKGVFPKIPRSWTRSCHFGVGFWSHPTVPRRGHQSIPAAQGIHRCDRGSKGQIVSHARFEQKAPVQKGEISPAKENGKTHKNHQTSSKIIVLKFIEILGFFLDMCFLCMGSVVFFVSHILVACFLKISLKIYVSCQTFACQTQQSKYNNWSNKKTTTKTSDWRQTAATSHLAPGTKQKKMN